MLGLGSALAKTNRKESDTLDLLATIIATLITAWLLWCGGFFSQANAAEPPLAALKYRNDVIRSARVDWGLNAPVADFAAQLHQESGWNPAARSPVGAQGLAQFMPSTADWIAGQMPHLASREPYNPGWAIRALVSYDRWLWQRVAIPDGCERMAMTLSAYNGGLGWVNRDRRLARTRGLDDARWFGAVETVNAGRSVANWRENRRYPQRILHELAPRYLSWGGSNCVG
ncbi:lytic transglycosylase domain-containing protein [Salmonella enterica]|uniref:Transglycosylase SLT domain-containing protein n=1 Tax=Salmonella enterica TaxID=28901 RepID=A0A629K6H3_SALER|nr:lytic transglycosylase domain-containing protein [Salmonella enterica]EDF8918439.1 transglycosylase SLT domain-containing protein [Salmonella enterica]EGG8606517.1 transglycosylase SLT domain-containing protein [Salmonella enterica]EGR6192257.1 transglycosylase SLT domain-containing protein [Salmonella enterica]MEI35808.1 lytic transglycosylase domain-containing protein [Salmonella enterica]